MAREPASFAGARMKLACGHSVIYAPAPPTKGQTVYCREHRDYFTVVGVAYEVRLRCMASRCRVSRSFGMSEGEDESFPWRDALRLASRHVMIYPGHRVRVRDSDDREEIVSWSGNDTLPFETEVAERSEANRSHHESLRDAVSRVRLSRTVLPKTAFEGSNGAAEPRSD